MNNKLFLGLVVSTTLVVAQDKPEVTFDDIKGEVVKLALLKSAHAQHTNEFNEAVNNLEEIFNNKDSTHKQARRALLQLLVVLDSCLEPLDPLLDSLKSYLTNDKYGETLDERTAELILRGYLELANFAASEVCAGFGGVPIDISERNAYDLDCDDLRTLLGMGKKAFAAKDRNRKMQYEARHPSNS
jgi:hypothetical protein